MLTTSWSETWTAPDGSPWPDGWSTAGAGTITVQGGRGRLQAGPGAGATVRGRLARTTELRDCDVTVTFVPSTNAEWYFTVGTRTPADDPDVTPRGMYAQVYSLLGFGAQLVRRGDEGGFTSLAETTTGLPTLTAGTAYRLRFRVEGSRLRLRVWAAASIEPSDWLLDVTDPAAYMPAGQVTLGFATGSAGTVLSIDVDDLRVVSRDPLRLTPSTPSYRHEWSMFSRDEDYALSGGLLISSASGVVRHLGVDTAVIETPYSEQAFARTAPGCGIALYRDGKHHFSGLVGSERSMGFDRERGLPTIKVHLVGDNVHAADRIAYPDPARAGDDQSTFDYWTPRSAGADIAVPGSTAMWRLLNEQLGPSARLERRVAGGVLSMGVDPAVGTVRRYDALFQDVMFCLQVFSIASGLDLGVRFLASNGALTANLYQPVDRSADVRFSADLSNLVGFDYTETAPSVTYALVPGQGDLHLRQRRAATSSDPLDTRWGRRIEKVFDRRDEANPTILQQAAADAIAEGRGQVSLSVALTDSEAARYGTDWGLGDRVTVYVGLAGQAKAATVTDVVREVAFQVNAAGAEKLTPAVGTPDAKALKPGWEQQAVAQVGRRLEGFVTRK